MSPSQNELNNIKFQDWEERAQVLANVTNRKKQVEISEGFHFNFD